MVRAGVLARVRASVGEEPRRTVLRAEKCGAGNQSFLPRGFIRAGRLWGRRVPETAGDIVPDPFFNVDRLAAIKGCRIV